MSNLEPRFEKELQERAVGLFHESLCSNGYMGLGSQESIEYSKHFKGLNLIESTNKIYQKIEDEKFL